MGEYREYRDTGKENGNYCLGFRGSEFRAQGFIQSLEGHGRDESEGIQHPGNSSLNFPGLLVGNEGLTKTRGSTILLTGYYGDPCFHSLLINHQ